MRGVSSAWPITENAHSIITHGTTEGDLSEALRIACDEAQRLLVDEWGFSAEDAFIFLSVTGDLGIAQFCHPCPGTVIARMSFPKLPSNPTAFAR